MFTNRDFINQLLFKFIYPEMLRHISFFKHCFILFFLPLCTVAQSIENNNFLKQSKTMEESWELGRENDKGLFLVTSDKPVYFTAGRWSSNPNTKPTSENPFYRLPFKVNYNKYEAKFQFSFKT